MLLYVTVCVSALAVNSCSLVAPFSSLPEADAVEVELPPGLIWVSIPDGSFEMGCSPLDSLCNFTEYPQHTVTVSGFRITETEITQAQYEQVMGTNPSHFEGCQDCPVEEVTWHDAKTFCEAVGGRLPSEAEWEYAARAGTTLSFYCGLQTTCLVDIAWYSENSDSTTHPVGEKTANAFGLYDMLGNVSEWTEDCWHSDYTDAPSTGGVWSGGDCTYRVLRGGSWGNIGLRASQRSRANPNLSYSYAGFRCAQ